MNSHFQALLSPRRQLHRTPGTASARNRSDATKRASWTPPPPPGIERLRSPLPSPLSPQPNSAQPARKTSQSPDSSEPLVAMQLRTGNEEGDEVVQQNLVILGALFG